MAKMIPDDIARTNHTKSEEYFYKELKKQLDSRIHCFYSIIWYTDENGYRKNSECDFLVFDPQFGFLVVEVKGGRKIELMNREWRIYYHSDDKENRFRVLKRSPMEQALESMYYFKNFYEEKYLEKFKGVYGSVVAFPFYSVNSTDLSPEFHEKNLIDQGDMDDLSNKINESFHYWRGQRNSYQLTTKEKKKFLNVVNKRIAISAAAGALINTQSREMKKTDQIQESFLSFIEEYKQAIILGGAGTGKTWLGIKKAKKLSDEVENILFVCYNKQLKRNIQKQFSSENIDTKTFHSLIYGILSESEYKRTVNNQMENLIDKVNFDDLDKYDAIIVDEAQDFNETWCYFLKGLLKNEKESHLFIFLDPEQNIFDRNYKNSFMIENPAFKLKNNIRNTSNIYEWMLKKIDLGDKYNSSMIRGADPEEHNFKRNRNARKYLNDILNQLSNEYVSNESIVILSDRKKPNSILKNKDEIGKFKIANEDIDYKLKENEIYYFTVQSFKGLESNVVIYIEHNKNSRQNDMLRYVAYTRARFFLYVINIKE